MCWTGETEENIGDSVGNEFHASSKGGAHQEDTTWTRKTWKLGDSFTESVSTVMVKFE
jgi:hypothetical protein